MTPDEIYHTSVDFNEDLELDINTYNIKANCEIYIYFNFSRNFPNLLLLIDSNSRIIIKFSY